MAVELGLLSDTHGLLRPEVLDKLHGCDRILHAGDLGRLDLLAPLRRIAPVHCVRGNVDPDSSGLPRSEALELGDRLIYVLHALEELDLDPSGAGIDLVIFGHSHQPACFDRDGVLYLNPGACGARRFGLPLSVARVRLTPGGMKPRFFPLDDRSVLWFQREGRELPT